MPLLATLNLKQPKNGFSWQQAAKPKAVATSARAPVSTADDDAAQPAAPAARPAAAPVAKSPTAPAAEPAAAPPVPEQPEDAAPEPAPPQKAAGQKVKGGGNASAPMPPVNVEVGRCLPAPTRPRGRCASNARSRGPPDASRTSK